MLSRRNLLTFSFPKRQINKSLIDLDLHFLNRVTWGPKPDEVAHLKQVGKGAYLEEQLHPERLDDVESEARLAHLPMLRMTRQALMQLLESGEERMYRTLIEGMILRAVHSKRQLLERMVDFWTDHFNVPIGEEHYELILYHRDAIRPHALGSFHDLLVATAKHPAMLVYLDNFVNVASHPNENYARELLELHTLGVDGGYTEADVKEVARAFTGWTVHERTRTGFYFSGEEHDTGQKQLLGHTLPAGRGIEDGLHVLNILAHHPATAQFLSRKLCTRFVSDQPSQELVNQTAQVWRESQGDIKSVLRHILLSAEFDASVGKKLRRPLDFFVGALRATGTEVYSMDVLEEILADLNQVPYSWSPPNGYPDVAGAWISTNGLLARWNVAMRLTHSAYSDAQETGWGLRSMLHKQWGTTQTVGELVNHIATQLFGRPLSASEQQPFLDYASNGQGGQGAHLPITAHLLHKKAASLYGLMLASPLYQWR